MSEGDQPATSLVRPPRLGELTLEERMQTVELALFGNERAKVRGLVDMMPAMARRVEQVESDVKDLAQNFKDGLAEVKSAIQSIRSGRHFWLQIALAGFTLAGVVITVVFK